MNLGTIETPDGYAYDGKRNPLLAQDVMSVTAMPNGRSYTNLISNAEYATIEAAVAFSMALHGSVDRALETTTARTSYPKYEIVLPEVRVNAGAIASILGNDPAYGFNDGEKGGRIAELLREEYDPRIHPQLVEDLAKAARR